METRESLVEALEARLSELETAEDFDAAELAAKEARKALDQHDTKVKLAQEARAAIARGTDRPGTEAQPEQRGTQPPVETRDVFREFEESSVVTEVRSRLEAGQGGIGRRGVTFDGLSVRAVMDLPTTSLLDPVYRRPGILTQPTRPLRLYKSGLLNEQQTTGNAIEYVRDTTPAPYAGNAAFVPEATQKPFSDYSWELKSDTVKTVAHLVDVTRQAFEDHGQLQGILRGKMQFGLEFKVDDAILQGDGTAGGFVGIMNTSGIGTYDVGVGNTEARIESVRRAKTVTNKSFYSSNVVGMTEDDWATIELTTDTTGAWKALTNNNVGGNLAPTLWGMNVVIFPGLTTGTALLGDFQMGCTFWDRTQPTLYITDSDQDKFQYNILTMELMLRCGLSVERPSAFVKIQFRGNA